MVIFRNRLFNERYLMEDQWVKLIYTKHALERIKERCGGSLGIVPSQIKITRKTITQGWIIDNKLKKFIFKMKYSKTHNLFLIIVDGNVVKTVWFLQIHKRKEDGISNNNYSTACNL